MMCVAVVLVVLVCNHFVKLLAKICLSPIGWVYKWLDNTFDKKNSQLKKQTKTTTKEKQSAWVFSFLALCLYNSYLYPLQQHHSLLSPHFSHFTSSQNTSILMLCIFQILFFSFFYSLSSQYSPCNFPGMFLGEVTFPRFGICLTYRAKSFIYIQKMVLCDCLFLRKGMLNFPSF